MKKVLYLLPFLLSGCSSMYIPQMANAPLFEEKGETQVELSNCLFDETESRDNLIEFIPSGPKVDAANKKVYELEDAYITSSA